MSLYIRLQTSFWNHRKTLRLRALLGDSALWIPQRLWCYAAENQPDGDFSKFLPAELAMLLGYSGDAQALLEALQQASFMDEMKIHDWQDHNGYHERFAERGKKAAAARWKGKDKTGQEKKRKEKSARARQALLDDDLSNATSINTEKDTSLRLLEYLNARAGKSFRNTTTNLGLIRARLKEREVTEEGCCVMLDRQVSLWAGTKMEEYLRPQTLFGKAKFSDYYDSRQLPLPANGQAHRSEHGLHGTIREV